MSSRPFRVLLSAHVDLNVIDGSAFFVSGVASLLTSSPGVTVHVVTATPIRRPVVIQEMLLNDRVTVTDPFGDESLAVRVPEFRGARRMDEPMAARVLSHYLDQGRHDVVVVRSTEVAHALSELRPDLGGALCVYVTGVVADDTVIDPAVRHRLETLLDRGATLLCQTPEMRDHLEGVLGADGSSGTIGILTPAVPSEDDVVVPVSGGPLVLAYTGKFAPAWHTVEMLAGFKEAVSAGADLRMVVAGDHFKRPPEWPTFAAEVRYLLESHPGVSWVGAVTRADARALVAGADVGIGWRHASPRLQLGAVDQAARARGPRPALRHQPDPDAPPALRARLPPLRQLDDRVRRPARADGARPSAGPGRWRESRRRWPRTTPMSGSSAGSSRPCSRPPVSPTTRRATSRATSRALCASSSERLLQRRGPVGRAGSRTARTLRRHPPPGGAGHHGPRRGAPAARSCGGARAVPTGRPRRVPCDLLARLLAAGAGGVTARRCPAS